MRTITITYNFGGGFEYEITPTKTDLFEFLEYYCGCNAKAKDFETISTVLDLDFADVVCDFGNEVYDEFEWFIKERYEEEAYDEYQDTIREERRMRNSSFY